MYERLDANHDEEEDDEEDDDENVRTSFEVDIRRGERDARAEKRAGGDGDEDGEGWEDVDLHLQLLMLRRGTPLAAEKRNMAAHYRLRITNTSAEKGEMTLSESDG